MGDWCQLVARSSRFESADDLQTGCREGHCDDLESHSAEEVVHRSGGLRATIHGCGSYVHDNLDDMLYVSPAPQQMGRRHA